MARGEVGTLTRGGFGADEEVRIDFTEEIQDAVIMLTGTNNGGNEYSLVVTSVDDTGFTFKLKEWEDEDGPHPATETINWIAVKPGIHELPDGRIIEAGTTTTGTDASPVTLNGDFSDPPVVLTNRMSENDPHVADSDPFNITADGFDVALQEGSRADGVNAGETVGYIAISQGGDADNGTAVVSDNLTTGVQWFDLGDSFTNGITLAETQTLNDADAGNVQLRNDNRDDEARLFFDEESGDGETAHVTESVGIVTFEMGIIPCYTAGTLITTARGLVSVENLCVEDLIVTRDRGLQKMRWLQRTQMSPQRLAAEPWHMPILIKRGALGPNLPNTDMIVSPQHRMLVTGWKAQLLAGEEEVLVPAKALINGSTIVMNKSVGCTYYHLLLDRHEIIFADGAPSESLHAAEISKNELSEQGRQDMFRQFPDLHFGYGPPARPCLPVSLGRLFAA